jgi:hypothetical protein
MQIQSAARHVIHLQFDISANTLEIQAVQSPKSDDQLVVLHHSFKMWNYLYHILGRY